MGMTGKNMQTIHTVAQAVVDATKPWRTDSYEEQKEVLFGQVLALGAFIEAIAQNPEHRKQLFTNMSALLQDWEAQKPAQKITKKEAKSDADTEAEGAWGKFFAQRGVSSD